MTLEDGLKRLARLFPEVAEFRVDTTRGVRIDLVCEDARLSAQGDDVASALRDAELALQKHRSTRTRMSRAEMRDLAGDALRLAKKQREESERAARRKPPIPPPMYGV